MSDLFCRASLSTRATKCDAERDFFLSRPMVSWRTAHVLGSLACRRNKMQLILQQFAAATPSAANLTLGSIHFRPSFDLQSP
jgi:hypothetical protein